MKVRTLLIDLDDTLVVEEKSAEESFRAAAEYLNLIHKIDIEEFVDNVKSEARRVWHSLPTASYAKRIAISSREALWGEFTGESNEALELRKICPGYRHSVWMNSLQKYGIDEPKLAQVLSDIFIRERDSRHIPFDDSIPFLQEVEKRNLRTCLVTNGAPWIQWRKINGSFIGKYFDKVVVSGELGTRKPNRDIFEHVLKVMRSKAEDSVMVGDRIDSDILGAQNTGIFSVWLNRTGMENRSDIIPDCEFPGLAGVLKILDS